MAVFTPLNETEIAAHIAQYDLGLLTGWQGITEGVENSNFFITTTTGRYVLTLFEKRVRVSDLPYYLGLMEWLNERGIRCPRPVHARDGEIVQSLKNKSAVIITFMEGEGVREIQDAHLPQLGRLLAEMHGAGKDFPMKRGNDLGPDGWQTLAAKIGNHAEKVMPGLTALIDEELHFLQGAWPSRLPGGAIHADLFPDNVFFLQRGEAFPKLSGVIDFYFACDEAWAYDVAICLNAWCFDGKGKLIAKRAKAMLEEYQAVRLFTREEAEAFPVLARGSALRFLLTRTYDAVFHPPDALVTPKDPREYLARLIWHRKAKPADYGL